jgi:hypothetical protein
VYFILCPASENVEYALTPKARQAAKSSLSDLKVAKEVHFWRFSKLNPQPAATV